MNSIADLVASGIPARWAKVIAAQIGWCDIDEEWAYASATTITVPTGAASRFQVGDKIRLTQTTVKYFYVVGVADTVLTVTGGSDYTVANAAISAVAYSRCERPFGFPDYFSHTFTAQTYSGLVYTPNTVYAAIFSLQGKWFDLVFNISGTTSGSDGPLLAINLPVTAHSYIGYSEHVTSTSGGASLASKGYLGGSTALISYGMGGASWGISANKLVSGHFRGCVL